MILEYIWIDSNSRKIQSKSKIDTDTCSANEFMNLLYLENLNLILKPVRVYKNPFQIGSYLVLSELYNQNMTPHHSNTRCKCLNDVRILEIEQQYKLYDRYISNTNIKLYCPVEKDTSFGRHVLQEHLQCCLYLSININLLNSDKDTYKYKISCNSLQLSDDIYISRYILNTIVDKYSCYVTFDPLTYNEFDDIDPYLLINKIIEN